MNYLNANLAVEPNPDDAVFIDHAMDDLQKVLITSVENNYQVYDYVVLLPLLIISFVLIQSTQFNSVEQ